MFDYKEKNIWGNYVMYVCVTKTRKVGWKKTVCTHGTTVPF